LFVVTLGSLSDRLADIKDRKQAMVFGPKAAEYLQAVKTLQTYLRELEAELEAEIIRTPTDPGLPQSTSKEVIQ